MSQILPQIISNCLSDNNELRRSGESEIFNYCANNYFKSLEESCIMIITPDYPTNIRQFCGTFLKHIFTTEPYSSLWNNLTPNQVEFVKTNLMASLASEQQEVRKSSSLAIAALAKIEIPKGWNVINVLYNTSHHENKNYRITSLLTFKNIIDFLGKKLKQDEINMILGAFTDNMELNLNHQVIHQAVQGIYNIIPFIENNFNNESQREYIINSLNKIMDINYIQQSGLDEIIQKDVLITYIHIMKYYTKYMVKSFSKTAEISFRYFHHKNQDLSALSIEIWNTICDEEQNQKENLITSAYQDTLNNGIIRIIQEREISFNLGDEWGSVKAAISLISSLVLSKNKKVYDKMLSYISECLNNDLVRKSENNFNSLTNEEKIKSLIIKQNAFFVYRGILLFKELDPEIIMESIKKIFSELKNINTLPIGDSIGESLTIICKVHFNLINETKNLFQPFFEQILKLLEFHINNKEVEYYILYATKYIFINANPEYFNKYLANIIKILMTIAYAKDSYNKDRNLTRLSFFLTGRIIEICQDTEENKNLIQQFFANLFTLFQESLENNYLNDLEKQYYYQNNLISIISSCCGGEYRKIKMNDIQIKCVFDLIEKSIIQRKSLFYEAVSVMGSLSYFGWELFSYINDKAMYYVLLSIDDRSDYELCFQGLLSADEIIRNLGNENIILIPKIVEKLQKLLNDPETPRGLKIKCFPLYNDIFMLHEKFIGEYLDQAMKLLEDGMKSSYDPPNEEIDKDTIEYLEELREKVVELLQGILFFLTEQKQTNYFSKNIDTFIRYLSRIVEPQFNSSLDLICEAGGLLADFYNTFTSCVKLYLNKNTLNIIQKRLEHSQNQHHKEVLLYMEQIFSDFNDYY